MQLQLAQIREFDLVIRKLNIKFFLLHRRVINTRRSTEPSLQHLRNTNIELKVYRILIFIKLKFLHNLNGFNASILNLKNILLLNFNNFVRLFLSENRFLVIRSSLKIVSCVISSIKYFFFSKYKKYFLLLFS